MQMIISRYGRWEHACGKHAQSVLLRSPSGLLETVSCFTRVPGTLQYDIHGYETVVPSGEPFRCARYTPTETGTYEFTVDDGEVGRFDCIASENHGYVGVGHQDSRYFAFSDGTPFPVIGTNLASLTAYEVSNAREFSVSGDRAYLGVREYARWFRKLSAAGGNHARIWVGQEYLSPDTEDPTKPDLIQFEKLDAIVELAREFGIYLKLTIDHFRFIGSSIYGSAYGPALQRLFGKRFRIGDRDCTSMTEWVQEPVWREAWADKVRQYLCRYAGDPIIMVFELWNEMNAVEAPREDIHDWNRYMAARLRPLAPKNMWSQSLGSMDSVQNTEMYGTFPFSLFSFSQFHRYLDQGAPLEICHSNGFEFSADGIVHARIEGMPVLLAETGAVNDCHSGPFRYYMSDDRGVIFADTVLPAFFQGAAGCGQIWHWGVYVEQKGLFHLLKPLAIILAGVQLETEAFQTENLSSANAYAFVLKGKHTVLGIVRNRSDSWENTLRDLQEPTVLPELLLHLSVAGAFRSVPIWEDETAQGYLYDGTLSLRNLKYGILFRIDRDAE